MTPLVVHCIVNQLTDMTHFIINFGGEYGVVLCYGICCFAMAVYGWMMMMGDAVCKYFLAFRVDDKRQRYRSW